MLGLDSGYSLVVWVGPMLRKYLVGGDSFPTERSQCILRLIENLTISAGAVGYLTESMHGVGSPMGQRIMVSRLVNLEHKEQLTSHLAGIGEGMMST